MKLIKSKGKTVERQGFIVPLIHFSSNCPFSACSQYTLVSDSDKPRIDKYIWIYAEQ